MQQHIISNGNSYFGFWIFLIARSRWTLARTVRHY